MWGRAGLKLRTAFHEISGSGLLIVVALIVFATVASLMLPTELIIMIWPMTAIAAAAIWISIVRTMSTIIGGNAEVELPLKRSNPLPEFIRCRRWTEGIRCFRFQCPCRTDMRRASGSNSRVKRSGHGACLTDPPTDRPTTRVGELSVRRSGELKISVELHPVFTAIKKQMDRCQPSRSADEPITSTPSLDSYLEMNFSAPTLTESERRRQASRQRVVFVRLVELGS